MPFFIIVVFPRGASARYPTGRDDWGQGGGCGRVISNLRRLRIRAHSNATGTSREPNFGRSCALFLGAEDGGALSFNVVVQKPVPGTSAGTTPPIASTPCTLRWRWRWRFCRLLLRSPS